MSRRRAFEVFLVLVVAAAAVAVLLWDQPKEERLVGVGDPTAPATAVDLEGLTILGVRPGMTRPEVEAVLGPGHVLRVNDGVLTTAYGRYETHSDSGRQDRWCTVTWTRNGLVETVRGSHLHQNGREIIGRGWPAGSLEPDFAQQSDDAGFGLYLFKGHIPVGVAASGGRIAFFALSTGNPGP